MTNLKDHARHFLMRAGLFRPIPERYQRLTETETIPFRGDRPKLYARDPIQNPYSVLDYEVERPIASRVKDLTYTAHGIALYRAAIDDFYTFSPIEPPYFRIRDYVGRKSVAEATVIQTEFNVTYGDWVSEIVRPIANAEELHGRLLLPERFARRAYVRPELEQLGVNYEFISRPVLIRSAMVLHKQHYRIRWLKSDVANFRSRLGVELKQPKRGSLTYLSRADVGSDQIRVRRPMPHAALAEMVASDGGITLATGKLRQIDYRVAAADVETVIADHGSAMVNLLLWNCRNVIELVTDDWWGPGMMILAKAAGVKNYAIVRHADNIDETLAKVEGHLRQFQSGEESLWDG